MSEIINYKIDKKILFPFNGYTIQEMLRVLLAIRHYFNFVKTVTHKQGSFRRILFVDQFHKLLFDACTLNFSQGILEF